MEPEEKPEPQREHLKEPESENVILKILPYIGGVLIIFCAVNVMQNLGFSEHHIRPGKGPLLSTSMVWLVNLACGLVGGLLLYWRRPVVAVVTGLVAAAGITAWSYAYLSWRESIINYEILVLLIVGLLPAVAVHGFLDDRLPK
jgi:hypothetical protein